MTTIRIEYDQSKCVGAGKCYAAAPFAFHVGPGGKAVLVDGEVDGHFAQMHKSVSASELQDTIQCAHLCPVNAIRVFDIENDKELVRTSVDTISAQVIDGHYDEMADFVMDPRGYLLIRAEDGVLEVAFCSDKNKVELIVRGKKPSDIYTELSDRNVLSRPEHYAYLGKELQKAYIAMKLGKEYVQDDELSL